MNLSVLINDLKLSCFTFDEKKLTLKKLNIISNNNSYEVTSEFIKLFRMLKKYKIDFLEDKKGNIQIIA